MSVSVDWDLIDKIRYNAKVRKLCRRMADYMDEEDVMSCVESTARVLRLLPDCLKERLIDKMIQTLDSFGEQYGS